MIRDFSNSAKKKLLEYVKDATETTLWRKIGDRIGDAGLQIQYWFGALSISKYIDNLDAYHKKIIDKNNTTSQRIEEIFTNVKNIDTRYQGGLQQNVNFSESVINFINDLANTIDPNGGNMDMQKMNAALAASLEKIQEAKLSREKAIEDSLLGTDPDAVETSIDPVNLSTGNFIYDFEDLAIDGEIPLSFHRYYNSKDSRISVLGKSFRHNYEIYLNVNDDGEVDIIMEDGQHKVFAVENGVYYGKNTATDFLTSDKQHFYLKDVDDNTYIFDKDKKLIRIENRNNLGISLTYDEDKLLIKVVNDYGDCLNYEYDEKTNLLARVFDHTGRDVVITYSDEKRIKTVCSALGKNISYEYASNGRIKDIVNSQKIHTVENIYDKKFRVIRQLFSDGGSMSFEYDDENHTVTQTERNGVQTIFVHDGQYRNTEIRYADGTVEKFVYNDKNQCIKYTDRLGRIQRMSYDNRGNLIQKIDALKRRLNMTYDASGRLLSMSINGIQKVKNDYDAKGNLVRTEDSTGNGVTVINDKHGRPIERQYPDGSRSAVTYDATSAGVNAVSQGIKIAKGEQEEFQWGSLAGSAVEGAVVGGVAAIPGLGTVAAAALTVTAGGVGAAANSAISQGIDEGKVDGKKVAEDAVIGAVVSGAFYGIGKGVKALKGKFSKTKTPTTKSTKDLYEDTIKGLKKNETKMDAIEAAGKKASSLTRKTQQRLLSERNSLLKKYGLEKLKSGFFSSKSGFSGVVDSVKKYAFMIFGIKTTKSIVKDLLKGMCPIYTSEDEQTLVEYMEDYFGTLYGKVTGKCPLYS
jgi:YD repeat-containing protein